MSDMADGQYSISALGRLGSLPLLRRRMVWLTEPIMLRLSPYRALHIWIPRRWQPLMHALHAANALITMWQSMEFHKTPL